MYATSITHCYSRRAASVKSFTLPMVTFVTIRQLSDQWEPLLRVWAAGASPCLGSPFYC